MVALLTRTNHTTPNPAANIAAPSKAASWRPRNRGRVAAGAFFVGISMLVALIAFRGSADRRAVLVVVRDVPAGVQVSAADIGVALVGADSSVETMAEAQRSAVIGEYAKTRLLKGSLLAANSLQPVPLVDRNSAVVAVQLARGALPKGLRELSKVWLVLTPAGNGAVAVVPASVVALPDELASNDAVSISFEVAQSDAANVATADKVAVLLVDPRTSTSPIAPTAKVVP